MSKAEFTGGVWGLEYGLVVIGGISYELDNAHDAPLIAAAPEMYEMLNRCHREIEHLHYIVHADNQTGAYEDSEMCVEIKRLLKKARGEHE